MSEPPAPAPAPESAPRAQASERRGRRRGPLVAEVVLSDERNGGQIRLESVNLSPGGVFVKSDLLFEVGEAFCVELTLPAFERGGHERTIVADARVGWVRRAVGDDGAPSGMGMVFVDIAPRDAEAIDRYLSVARPGGGDRAP